MTLSCMQDSQAYVVQAVKRVHKVAFELLSPCIRAWKTASLDVLYSLVGGFFRELLKLNRSKYSNAHFEKNGNKDFTSIQHTVTVTFFVYLRLCRL